MATKTKELSAYQKALQAERIKQADIRTKQAADNYKATQSKNRAAEKAAWNKAATSNQKSKSSSSSSSKDKQASAGSDVKTVVKVIGGQIVTVPVAQPKKQTAATKQAEAKERTKMRSLSQEIKNDSMKSLTTKSDKLNSKVTSTAKKITSAQESIAKNQKVQDSFQDFINAKGGDAAKANENVKAIDDKIADIQKEISSSKRKTEKDSLQKQITSLTKDKAKDNALIAQFSKNADYQKQVAKNKRASANIKTLTKSISAMKKRKTGYKNKLDTYKKEIKRQKDIAQKNAVKKNWKKIESTIQNDTDSITHQRQKLTYIYRADHKTSEVVKLLEISPSEQNQVNIPQKSIDSGLPLEHFAQQSGLTLSGQYNVYAETYDQRVAIYNLLRKWQNSGVAVGVRGFLHWNNVFMTSVSRSVSAESNANTLVLNIEMQHARIAKIKYAKSAKKGKKHKAKASKSKGTKNPKHRTVTIKPGMTYSQISAKTGIKVSTLEQQNKKYKATSLPVGAKIEVS